MAINKSRDQYLDAYLAVVPVVTAALQPMPTQSATVGLARAVFVVDASGVPVPSPSGSTIASGQVAVASTAGGTLIVAARAGRSSVTIVNDTGTADVFLGAAGLTTGTGLLLVGVKGGAIEIATSAAIYGIVGSTPQTVSFMESY